MRKLAMTLGLICAVSAQAPEPPWKFSEVMRELSSDRRFVEAFLARIDRNPAAGALLGPENLKLLRNILFGAEWEKLDRFPGITLATLGRGVWAAGKTMEPASTLDPQVVPPDDDLILPAPAGALEPLAEPEDLGYELTFGDAPDPARVAIRANSLRLADVLNRLSLHGEEGYRARTPVGVAANPSELVKLLQQQGFQVTVHDARYFANFGDLRFRNRDVVTPFWIDTNLAVPGAKRTLLVPATHSQTEIELARNGPVAAIAFFFGIDGKAAYRAIDTADQGWVGGFHAHSWEGARAGEAAQAVATVMRAYKLAQQAYPNLPFGGYHALGVCNDASAMVEQILEGRTTLFPLVAEPRHFQHIAFAQPVLRALPNDRKGVTAADFPRIVSSMPFARIDQIPLPQLRADLKAIQRAGAVEAGRPAWLLWLLAAAVAAAGWWLLQRSRRS
jgi:hypothetical protein